MKYNISNLDQFKNLEVKVSDILVAQDIQNNLVKQISDYKHGLLEETIKELVRTHVDIEKLNMLEIANELSFKDLELKCVENLKYTRYSVINKMTKEEDFFLVKNDSEIKQEGNMYTINNYMSDIIRGIKQ